VPPLTVVTGAGHVERKHLQPSSTLPTTVKEQE
jgi:hypothetical protein